MVTKTYCPKALENRRFRLPYLRGIPSPLPHCRLTPHLQGTPSYIHANLILPENRVIGLHLRRWQYRSIFIQIFVVGSERRMCFETEWIMALQGHPRSLIFGTNRKHVCHVLLVINSNLGPTLPRFTDITGFLLRRLTPLVFYPYFRDVPVGLSFFIHKVILTCFVGIVAPRSKNLS